MSIGNNEKWILVEWGNGHRGIVHSRYLVNVDNRELLTGCSVVVSRRGEQQIATFLGRSNERPLLEEILKEAEATEKASGGPAAPNPPEEEPGDFSGSVSSWVPSGEDSSDTSEEEEAEEEDKMEESKSSAAAPPKEDEARERSVRRVLTPSNRVNAVIPRSMRKNHVTNNNKTRKRKENRNNETPPHFPLKDEEVQSKSVNVNIKVEDVLAMKNMFKELFNIFKSMRQVQHHESINKEKTNQKVFDAQEYDPITPAEVCIDHEMEKSPSEDLNRSDDNVLITNKYHVENIQTQNKEDVYKMHFENNDEMIPIGSGKTLVPRDKFRRIKWTSYTVATRGLLLAVFPRRTLATHSLTGKKSPAFRNKPAKMCLDPKRVSDIIIEVMDRFRVKENQIRTIITTKCADECKMFKMRMNKRKGITPQNNQCQATPPNDNLNQQAPV